MLLLTGLHKCHDLSALPLGMGAQSPVKGDHTLGVCHRAISAPLRPTQVSTACLSGWPFAADGGREV